MGDIVERFYWPQVGVFLSQYELFWKKFVVLLTNRVDALALADWIMLCDKLPKEYELVLVANYNTLYHCAAAHKQLEVGRKAKAN